MDDKGIIPDDLDKLIQELIIEGKNIKYLYTIPEFQNPTGSTMPLQRRKDVLGVLKKYNLPLLLQSRALQRWL